jgi:hypothetical protein
MLLGISVRKWGRVNGRSDTYSSLDFLTRGQSQTCAIHLAMVFSYRIMLMIHGCESMSFGVGRVNASTMSLMKREMHEDNPPKI